MWLIILSLALATAVAGMIYLISRVSKFSFIQKIIQSKSPFWGKIVSAIIVVAVATLLCVILGIMNAIIVFINLAGIWLICDFAAHVAALFATHKCKINEKYQRVYYAGIIAIALTALYLGFAYYNAVHVVMTEYKIEIGENIQPLKIALIADSHVGATMSGDDFSRYIDEIAQKNPDVLVIAGDLFDDSTSREDMILSCAALGKIETKYGVFYSFGNHDRGYNSEESRGYDADEFTSRLREEGVVVLEDEIVNIGDDYCIIGRKDKNQSDRKSISELMGMVEPGRYSIVLDHQPSDYDEEESAGCNLVLSGHTHGGQMIPITYVGEWIGANDATYGYERRGNTDFIVTSGIGDWELLFKSGCKSEYVMINISNDGA